MNIPIYLPQEQLPTHLANLNIPTTNKQPDALCLIYENQKLGLKDFNEPKTGAVIVDFTSDALQYRAKDFRKGQGSIKNEAIGKALGLKNADINSGKPQHIIDATAGLGRDSFMLMTLGAKVTLLERSPAVAALLQDGIYRAQQSDSMPQDFNERFQFHPGQATDLLSQWQGDIPDAIYLDPMFPHKKKSALVKKEMRLFQQLLGPDDDADNLLKPALNLAKKRVVVKRPDYAPFLANTEPTMQIKSKKHRFDVYLT